MEHATHDQHYWRLSAMLALSFLSMYVLMYSMVNTFSNVLPNVNQFYMAGLMTAPMMIIELVLMGSMYPNKKLNAAVIALGVLLLGAFWTGIRAQGGVSDRQFLKSMIPHHAGAILMCQKAPIADTEIKGLCKEIVSSQQREIEQMKATLERLDRGA